jgi:hypothetical protein
MPIDFHGDILRYIDFYELVALKLIILILTLIGGYHLIREKLKH